MKRGRRSVLQTEARTQPTHDQVIEVRRKLRMLRKREQTMQPIEVQRSMTRSITRSMTRSITRSMTRPFTKPHSMQAAGSAEADRAEERAMTRGVLLVWTLFFLGLGGLILGALQLARAR